MGRFQMPREFVIPKDAIERKDAESDAVAYLYQAQNGKPAAMVFYGKQTKPIWRHWFPREEHRENKICEAFENRRATTAMKAEWKAKRTEPHPLKVGDILHTSWGYDQTNVEFFEVTRIIGPHTVELRELQQHREETGFMSGKCRPIAGKYREPRHEKDDTGKPIVRRARGNGSVRIDDVRDAWPGAGEHYWSSYA